MKLTERVEQPFGADRDSWPDPMQPFSGKRITSIITRAEHARLLRLWAARKAVLPSSPCNPDRR